MPITWGFMSSGSYQIYFGRYELLANDVRNISVAATGDETFYLQCWVTVEVQWLKRGGEKIMVRQSILKGLLILYGIYVVMIGNEIGMKEEMPEGGDARRVILFKIGRKSD